MGRVKNYAESLQKQNNRKTEGVGGIMLELLKYAPNTIKHRVLNIMNIWQMTSNTLRMEKH
jgi:hypothetical protein